MISSGLCKHKNTKNQKLEAIFKFVFIRFSKIKKKSREKKKENDAVS